MLYLCSGELFFLLGLMSVCDICVSRNVVVFTVREYHGHSGCLRPTSARCNLLPSSSTCCFCKSCVYCLIPHTNLTPLLFPPSSSPPPPPTHTHTHTQVPQREPKYQYTPNDYLTCTVITALVCGLFSPLTLMFTIPAYLFSRRVSLN